MLIAPNATAEVRRCEDRGIWQTGEVVGDWVNTNKHKQSINQRWLAVSGDGGCCKDVMQERDLSRQKMGWAQALNISVICLESWMTLPRRINC